MEKKLAQQTIAKINSAMSEGQVSAVGELSRIIHALAKDTSEISLADLAELIEQDSQVLSRIISVANTLGYNPTNSRITTASDAIHVVGFERVRSLALSLSLMEHVDRSYTNATQQEMASLSLCSGLIAQAAASQGCILDPDMAFICGSLRNFGRLLLSTFASDEFEQARKHTHEISEDEAYRLRFGLTPLNLGHELLRARNLPELVLHAVSDVPAEIVDALPWIDRQYLRLAQFSFELAQCALNPEIHADEFKTLTLEMAARYGAELPQLKNALPEIISKTETRLLQLTKSKGNPKQELAGLSQFRDRRIGRDIPRPAPPDPTSSQTALEPASMAQTLELVTGMNELAEALPHVLESLQKDLACAHLLYCSRRPPGQEFYYEHGKTSLAARINGRSLGGGDERDIIFLCCSRRENILIRDATATNIRPYLPAWLKSMEAPVSFALLPVHHEDIMDAFVLVGWDEPSNLAFPPDKLHTIRLLLAHIAKLKAQN